MTHRLCHKNLCNIRLVLKTFATLVFLAMTLSSCATQFPEKPPAHPIARKIQEAGGPYYFNVQQGVFSRVVAIQPENLMRALLSAVEARWDDVDSLETSDALVNYFRARGLAPLAERIEETLSKNAQRKPSDFDHRLEARAIKQGLVEVFYEVQREHNR